MNAFLAPAFLLGLLALAVPVAVHLMHRERRVAVAFPSLMFLRRIPFRSVRRQKLRHLALFLARCLAFSLLALSFARPFFAERQALLAAPGGARVRVIVLDRSYSMGYRDRFARGVAAAERALAELGPDDEAGLILFSDRAEGVAAPTTEHARVLGALRAARLSSSGTRFAPALKLAQDWLLASSKARREVVLVSDCQKRGLPGLEEVRLPAGSSLRVVSLAEADPANSTLGGVSFDRELQGGRERIAATARVVNKGKAAATQSVALEIGGRVVEQKPLRLEPNGAGSVTFAPVAYPAGATRGRVLLGDDALLADNVHHFVLAPGQELAVLVVEDGGSGLYVRRALSIGDRPRFRVRSQVALGAADLKGHALVVFAGTLPPDAAAAALVDYVRSGGGALVSLAAGGGWRGAAATLLPPAPRLVDRTADRGATLAWLELDHPALELFKAPRSGDFSAARFLRYRPLQPAEGDRVLARFDDGAVALAERELGAGKVLAFASGFDSLTNDLALQPVFLPLIHQLARRVAGHTETRLSRSVGEALSVATAAETPPATAVVTAPGGERVRLEKGRVAVELLEAGFYQVEKEGAAPEVVAVNVDAGESDLAAVDAEELQGALTRRDGAPAAGSGTAGPLTPQDAERRQSLWWYLLTAAFLLLLAETLLSNRLSSTPAAEVAKLVPEGHNA
jgi:hypothetical protein